MCRLWTLLFSSNTKFDSGTGWPSFYQPYEKVNIKEELDTNFGMKWTEVLFSKCRGYLDHLFNDEPKPIGCRYCINSASIDFVPDAIFQK